MEQLEFDFHKYAEKQLEIFKELLDCINDAEYFIEYPNLDYNVATNQIIIYSDKQKITFTIDIKME
jgi:hypothetical protein